jgi:hypothetical protein
MTTLHVCAIVRDEGLYLAEWLAHYRGQGVTQFWLYDNESTDGGLEAYDVADVADVRVLPWPGRGVQLAAYEDARSRCPADWLAFLDVDEFCYHPDGRRVLDVVAAQPPAVDAVWAPWRMFGYGGHLTRPPGPVVQAFRDRAADDHPHHAYAHGGKSIARPARVRGFRDPHHLALAGGDGARVDDTGLLVNHYVTKSRAEALIKIQRPRIDTGQYRAWAEVDGDAQTYGAVRDDRLAQLTAGVLHAS